MEIIQGMEAFLRAAEARSFTVAAKNLGLTSSGVGKAVSRLEQELGVRLLHRTTRKVALTDEGAIFLEHCRRVLDEVELARASLAERSANPRGRVRVSLPHVVGLQRVMPALARFRKAWPDVSLDISLSDRRVNLAEEGFDLAVRVGDVHDTSLVARKVASFDVLTVAAPSFLAHTPIATLGDLAFVPSIAFRLATTGRERPWGFRVDGRLVEWTPRAPLVIDSGDAMVEAAIGGAGVTQVPAWTARDALASGKLVEVLTDLRGPGLAVNVVYRGGRGLPPRTRAFLEFLVGLPAWKEDARVLSKRRARGHDGTPLEFTRRR